MPTVQLELCHPFCPPDFPVYLFHCSYCNKGNNWEKKNTSLNACKSVEEECF